MTLHLRYDTRRVDCPDCGVKVEQLPWAETSSWFTRPFEDHVGYVAQRCDRTTVGAMMRVAWETVGAIVQRVVARHRDRDLLDGLRGRALLPGAPTLAEAGLAPAGKAQRDVSGSVPSSSSRRTTSIESTQ